jgi:hypothetical protein
VSSLWFVRWTMTGMELLQSYCLADHLYLSHPRELTATQGSSFHFVLKTKDLDLDANGASHHANSADASTCSTEKGLHPWWLIRQPHLLEPQWLQQLLGLDAWNLIVQHENPAVPETWTINIWRWSRNWLRGRITLAQRKRKKKPITITNLAGYYTNE